MTTACAEAHIPQLTHLMASITQQPTAAVSAMPMKFIYTTAEAHAALRKAEVTEANRARLLAVQKGLNEVLDNLHTLALELDLLQGTRLESEAARVQQCLDTVTDILDE